MAQLNHTIEELSSGTISATMVNLSGSVDPESIESFDAIFDELIDTGNTRIIMDLGKLKYINSTGMGIMVQYLDQLEEEGGGLVLVNVQPKILLVLEMLGLQELFQIVGTDEEALAALSGDEVAPASIEVKLDEIPSIEVQRKPAAINSPVLCGGCGASLSTPTAGAYKCPRCGSLLKVAASGAAETFAHDTSGAVEFSIEPDETLIKGSFGVIAAAGTAAGLLDARDVAKAIAGCLSYLSEHALEKSAKNGRLNVFMKVEKGKLITHIHCGGKAITSDASFDKYKDEFDSLSCKATAAGNLLTIKANAN